MLTVFKAIEKLEDELYTFHLYLLTVNILTHLHVRARTHLFHLSYLQVDCKRHGTSSLNTSACISSRTRTASYIFTAPLYFLKTSTIIQQHYLKWVHNSSFSNIPQMSFITVCLFFIQDPIKVHVFGYCVSLDSPNLGQFYCLPCSL